MVWWRAGGGMSSNGSGSARGCRVASIRFCLYHKLVGDVQSMSQHPCTAGPL